MLDRPQPDFRFSQELVLNGTLAIYTSQAEASAGIPAQWRDFLLANPALGRDAKFFGASPCTSDRRIHYLTGVLQENTVRGESLTLEAGEYAVVQVENPALLRDTWIWLLSTWLPGSGRIEKHAPEFERYTRISRDGLPVGPVEIWIPLLPIATP